MVKFKITVNKFLSFLKRLLIIVLIVTPLVGYNVYADELILPKVNQEFTSTNFDRKAPSAMSYINNYLFFLQNNLKELYKNYVLEISENSVILVNYNSSQCKEAFIIEAFSSKSQVDNELTKIVEGIKIQTCSGIKKTIELERLGKNIESTEFHDLLLGYWPLPTTEMQWSLRVEKTKGSIVYQNINNIKKTEFIIDLTSQRLAVIIGERDLEGRIDRNYRMKFLDIGSILSLSAIWQGSDESISNQSIENYRVENETVSYLKFSSALNSSISVVINAFMPIFFNLPNASGGSISINLNF